MVEFGNVIMCKCDYMLVGGAGEGGKGEGRGEERRGSFGLRCRCIFG